MRFASAGANIALTDLAPAGPHGWRGIESVAEEIAEQNGSVTTVYADICQMVDVERMVQHVIDAFGQIDMLIANAAAAAGPDRVQVTELPESALDQTLNVNIRGTFLCCKAVGRHFEARKAAGRIVLMSSVLGKRGLASQAAYSSSKFAITGLAQCLAHELGPLGVTVNAICPGTIANSRIYRVADATRRAGQSSQERYEEMLASAVEQTALKRVGRPEDVANLAAFLCSSDADYITGQSISVCGGKIMH